MIRRSHKKSRQGCTECKRSHKKCDESQPACVNCVTAQKECSYSRTSSSEALNERNPVSISKSNGLEKAKSSHLSVTSDVASLSSRSVSPVTPLPVPYVNLLHLELFQNVTSNGLAFHDDSSQSSEWVTTTIRYTFSNPYLMYEMLALSALHLSIKHPSKSDFYRTESTTLQAHALSIFNTSNPSLGGDDLIPTFLFSATLGLHFFCETFSHPSPDLNIFLDHLVQSINLLRGVNAIVQDSWEYIKNSDIKCLLQAEGPAIDRGDEISHAFEDLHDKFSHLQYLPTSELRIYSEAIKSLIWVYSTQPSDAGSDGPPSTRLVTSWPIKISAEYAELLQKRKPEALVIMAYFCILLHSLRDFWPVGDAGIFLLNVIGEYLGSGWDEWLVVPRLTVQP